MGEDDGNDISDEVIARFVATKSRNSTARERVEFARWTAEDEARIRAVGDLRRLDSDMDSLRTFYVDEVRALVHPQRLSVRNRMAGLAAACIAILGLAFVADPGRLVSASDGMPVTISLGDGSRIALDVGASVEIPYAPWSHRVTLLGGDAMFDVVHDENRPFTVSAGRVVITDIGTRFLLRSERDSLQVAVYEGAVDLEDGGGTVPRRLAAPMAVAVSSEGTTREIPVPNEMAATAWRQGRLVFDNTPLSEVAERLSRYRGDRVVVGSPSIASLRVSGSFDLENRAALLRAIELTHPVISRKGNGEVTLMPAPPRTMTPPKVILP